MRFGGLQLLFGEEDEQAQGLAHEHAEGLEPRVVLRDVLLAVPHLRVVLLLGQDGARGGGEERAG